MPDTGNIGFESFDFDGDGDIDVIANYDNTLYWFEHIDGQNKLSEGVVLIENTPMLFYKAQDMDGDNDKDLVFATYSGNLKFLAWVENIDGVNEFGPQQTIDSVTGYGSFKFLLNDMDDDGDFDILGIKDDIIWYENVDGQGDFSSQYVVDTDVANFSSDLEDDIVVADIDNDGDKDLVTMGYAEYMKLYENLGNNVYDSPQEINYYDSIGFCVLDIDGDSYLDIVISANTGFYWIQNISGTFSDSFQMLLQEGGTLGIRGTADINLDGNLDMLVHNYSDLIFKLNNNGVFEEELNVSMELKDSNEVITVDLDGDSDLDLVATDYYGKVFSFTNLDGLGFYSVQKHVLDNDNFGENQKIRVSVADLDGDNDNDIISVSAYNGRILWQENLDGAGTFGDEQIINDSLTNEVRCVDVEDIDNDGDNDIVVGTVNGIYWLKNDDGQGNSWQLNQVDNYNYSREILLNDIDGDNDFDIVYLAFNSIVWVENLDGLGTFGSLVTVSSSANFQNGDFVIEDMNLDGFNDIIVSSEANSKISYLKHLDGNGTFEESIVVVDEASGVSSIDVTDVDNDGDADIVASLSDLDVVVWYENLDGIAESFSNYNVVSTNVDNASFVTTGDINQDNLPDILSVSPTFSHLIWSKNLSLTNRISGFVNYTQDLNNSECNNANSVSNILIGTSNGLENKSTFSLLNGHYQLYPAQEGSFRTQVMTPLPLYYVSNPSSQTTDFEGQGNVDSADFCIAPIGEVNDLEISAYPLSNARPGFESSYRIVYKNVGTTIVNNGLITFDYDFSKMNFISANEAIYAETSGSVAFEYNDLDPFEIRTIDVDFNVYAPPIASLGDILFFDTEITPWTQDQTIFNNSYDFNQIVVGSYDPNDIQVLEGEQILIDDIDKYLHYIIRFQNTGTASVINVRVNHVLDDKLDWTTMQLESMSHEGRVEITDETNVDFIFNNINLPDSVNDESNSHGFIAFKIKLKQDVALGDVINGIANIYFDFNPPIITNMVSTEIAESLSIEEVEVKWFTVYPNPVDNTINISFVNSLENIEIYNQLGQVVYKTYNETSIDVSELESGIYFLRIEDELRHNEVIKIIKR